jgi:HlyD family secretion protein/adhesin transport system membrane fusion protein
MSKGKRRDGAKAAREQDRGAATGGDQGPRGRLAQDLSLPLSLEEGRPPRLAQHASYLVLVAIAGFFAWAATAQLTERAAARGQITPAGSSYSVQHPDGGTVAALAVSEGQTVEAGQTLLRLAPQAATADLDQLLAREAALRLKAERLSAFAQDRAPDFSFAADYPDLVADQRDILRTQNDSRAQQLSVIDRQIEQRRSRLASARDRLPEAKRQVAIMKEQLEMRRELAEKGLVSRVVLLETERAHSEATARLAGLRSEIAEARQAVDEARERQVELRAQLTNEAFDAIGQTNAELAETRAQLAKLRDRVRRLRIAAPSDGVVEGLEVNSLGAVVKPGEPLMRIVPTGKELVAEVRLDPQDVGHVAAGDPARVKVSTYDPMTFGTIAGRVRRISASTFTTDDGVPYYRTEIALDSSHFSRGGRVHALLPGMIVDADIVTGEKTVLGYLAKPVYRALSQSFGER